MNTMTHQPSQMPGSLRHQDSPDRWRLALKRAKDADVKVYQLAAGRFAVTSAHDAHRAYEVKPDQNSCTCTAAIAGDPVCLHRAAVRAYLSQPDPEPPVHGAYDPDEEALRWAKGDLDRAHRDLNRFNRKIEQDGSLSESDYRGFVYAQEREQDASERIAILRARIAQNGRVAA